MSSQPPPSNSAFWQRRGSQERRPSFTPMPPSPAPFWQRRNSAAQTQQRQEETPDAPPPVYAPAQGQPLRTFEDVKEEGGLSPSWQPTPHPTTSSAQPIPRRQSVWQRARNSTRQSTAPGRKSTVVTWLANDAAFSSWYIGLDDNTAAALDRWGAPGTAEGVYSPTEELDDVDFANIDEKDLEAGGRFAPNITEKRQSAMSQWRQTVVQARKKSVAAPADPNIVCFDGPDDPLNAQNWPMKRKVIIAICLASMTFITPLASSMFAPGIPLMVEEFHVTSTTLAAFSVSAYILGYATGPAIVAPLCEIYGRAPVYNISNILFTIMTLVCGFAPNINTLIALRFFEGCAGVTALTLGGGTVGDMFRQDQRGAIMALWSFGPLLGPIISPVIGGFLCEARGWRWVFYLITILAGVDTIATLIFLKETYPVIILERKAARLRKETGNPNLRSKLATDLPRKAYFKRSLVRPLKILFCSPIVLSMASFMAIIYGYLYLMIVTIPVLFEHEYGFGTGNVGLCYLGLGFGLMTGLFIVGRASDVVLRRMAAKNGGKMKPEFRLPCMIPAGLCIPIGMFIYGWSAQAHVYFIVPIIGTFFIGLGFLGSYMPVQTYLVDCFGLHAASAIAACCILRSVVGALLPLGANQMFATLGYGWGYSLLGFIGIALCPIPIIFLKYGERVRTNPRFKLNL